MDWTAEDWLAAQRQLKEQIRASPQVQALIAQLAIRQYLERLPDWQLQGLA